ncbi:Methionyl-tRNA formyltransferase [Haliscomenobacter hydrossis DSM 1100]|uniref:Methionyl-tRNA formyltransferase n=2 Tax=Haliscomenobacter TaxID=2349 RepID=F4KZJ3_HALH1|nr:Methionyl-tRNA formyltransferase [Haliscomenobacter hydrossis DSM 1100]
MGTPDFAVPALDILVQHGYEIVGVVTVADKMGGRGMKQVLESPVKKYAVAQGIPVLQPEKLRNPEFLAQLRDLGANLQIVVAFRMLPEVVWSMPGLGTFNLHGSLLPRYRGAAPINWAVINGDTETGVTTFFLQHEIDTGSIIFQDKMTIGEDETAGDVHDRMMQLGAGTVLKTVQAIEAGTAPSVPQDDAQASHAPKIFHETCQINFEQSTAQVHNFVRGLSPFPAAWTTLDGQELKVLRSAKETAAHDHPPGNVFSDGRSYLKFSTRDGFVQVLELQLQGRKRMLVKDFLNGYKVQ